MLGTVFRSVGHSVRTKLLVLVLAPLLVGVPLLLGLVWTWGNEAYQRLLTFKIQADLIIAHEYFDRVRQGVGNDLQSLAESKRLADRFPAASETELRALLDGMLVRYNVDFLHVLDPAGRPLASARGERSALPDRAHWPAVSAAIGGVARTGIELFSSDELAAILSVVAIWSIAVVTPGPNTLIVAHTTMSQGRAVAARLVVGTLAATAGWVVFGLFGLTALVAAAPDALAVGKVVVAVSTTPKVKKLCDHYGLEYQVTKIGFKWICGIMINEDVLLGGEESGGIAIKGHIPERDGIWMGLTIWEFMAKSGKSLDDLIDEVYGIVGPFKYERNDLHISEDLKARVLDACEKGSYVKFGDLEVRRVETIDGYKFHFDKDQWLMIRASGTEPVLRCYAESDTLDNARAILASCQRTIGA